MYSTDISYFGAEYGSTY